MREGKQLRGARKRATGEQRKLATTIKQRANKEL
jgi:hypothetical protein